MSAPDEPVVPERPPLRLHVNDDGIFAAIREELNGIRCALDILALASLADACGLVDDEPANAARHKIRRELVAIAHRTMVEKP